MKIIELLGKIANGEEVPKKIKIGTHIFTKFNHSKGDGTFVSNYESNNDGEYYLNDFLYPQYLNDEVEIIEEDNKIEKLDTWFGIKPVNGDSPTTFKENAKYIDHNTEIFFEKINEIIDKVNKLGE